MTTAEQRIPLLPSPPGSVLKPVGNQMHPGDDSILAGSLSSNSKIVLQPSVPESWACMAQVAASTRFAYDTFFQNGVGAYGRYVERYQPFDVSVLAGSRRKNATRETTSTLKAWLHEHRKNPYPTKGEKIMLAILTKMTLTQVSTWFANARRRLKKENKMTWLPRNKSGVKESDKASPGAHSGSDDINTDSEDNDSDFESDDERAAGNDNTDLSADHVSAFQKAELVIKRLEHDKSDTPNVMSGGNESIKKESTSSDTKPLNNIIWNFETEKINQTETGPSTIGNSPVNSLQRWVNVCFETQSPVDFPKELTPPHTPVETNKQAATFISSMRSPLQEERSAVAPKMDHLNNTFSRFDAGTKLPESSETTLTLSSLARITETRPCILTSHRELDAVLALTSLASR